MPRPLPVSFLFLPRARVGVYNRGHPPAHYWARELRKLGHEVCLMPAKDVKAYVKRNKNDAVDAEASCEAVRRPTMRFVGVKSAEQQGRLMQASHARFAAAAADPGDQCVTGAFGR